MSAGGKGGDSGCLRFYRLTNPRGRGRRKRVYERARCLEGRLVYERIVNEGGGR